MQGRIDIQCAGGAADLHSATARSVPRYCPGYGLCHPETIGQPHASSLKAQPTHLLPKGRARDAEQDSGLRNFAARLAYGFLDVQAFRALARLGEPCDALSWVVEQSLFREDRLSRNLRRGG